ncbi:uncharacterized protein LOC100845400 [Brachypodium distachyon]|uniref:E3 ubiquitin-protein ligase RMA n=1 Tax=Brachypodium distachyon TaxID=15368 RepID=I1I1C0_BRADI|nr:uncharacterized protein LOC100845400 [Brachypodium distachyon]KQJ95279.1 hypothetical protein BRADI_3g16210v3 [Brachypodium distachyon]|eukprot:XP_003571448.1 uncharacterized protein LOC100845400 [Brachypodium distachyon]
MAGEEPVEGSQSRSRMDLNLTQLPRPLGQLGGAIDCLELAKLQELPIAEVPRTGEVAGLQAPEETPLQPAVYSSSNALSMPELPTPELSLIDPMIIEWIDNLTTNSGEGLDVGEPAAVPANDGNVSSPVMPPPLPTLVGSDDIGLEWVERRLHPLVVPHVIPMEMVNTTRGHGGGAIEEMTPELHPQRLSQVSEHHCIMSPGPVTRNQRATSPEGDRLVQAIKESHSSLVASRGSIKCRDCGCNSSFGCNICLEAAKEPVVTPCGHMFCWPCLYQWLHGRSVHPVCPVCKGGVLEVNVTPIYGSSGDERGASNNHIPPRPRANRTGSLRQHLEMQESRGIANMVRQFIENQEILRANSVAPGGGGEVTVLPAAQPRGGRVQRQQRQDNDAGNTNSPTLQQVSNPAPRGGIQVTMQSSSADNDALAIPQQSSSMEQASTSSTVAVIVGQTAQSRRSRPSESTTTTRRTRRRRQQQQQ